MKFKATESMSPDDRLNRLTDWLQKQLNTNDLHITVASADASFRRYFRVQHDGQSWIAMDAPPDKENCQPFIHIAECLTNHGINAPRLYHKDLQQGFLLISDLGSQPYLPALHSEKTDILYKQAIDTLVQMQGIQCNGLPAYDETLLHNEMQLFIDWFLTQHLKLELSNTQQQALANSFQLLIKNALHQPQVFVHRDYHSRNLMVTAEHNPGVLDFQDAVDGALTYDLVSLLKDCYISWPRQQIEHWLTYYLTEARNQAWFDSAITDAQFIEWFDFMGVQRHLKAIGIFSRLNIRDKKPGYLDDIPRTFNYIIDSCQRYPKLSEFKSCLQQLNIAEQLGLEWQQQAS